METFTHSSPGPVRRLRLRWQAGEWSLEKVTYHPEMALPRSDDLSDQESEAGFWFEAVDDSGQVLYRQRMADPTEGTLEVFMEGGEIRRSDKVREEAEFDILVPDAPEISHLRFFSSNPKASKQPNKPGRSRLVASLPLR